MVTTAQAEIITVDDDGPAEFDNIQAAIDDANAGDVIEVRTGTYTGRGNRAIDFRGKAITVRSTDANDPAVVAATIVDCNASAAEPNRAFYFHTGEDVNSVLAGMTIINGYYHISPGGGAIFCSSNSRPTISNCIIKDNFANLGGGINCAGNNPVISNCIITANRAIIFGGGIHCQGGSPTVLNSLLSGNRAASGGALSCIGSSCEIVNSTFSGNAATTNGGGIYALSSPALAVTNCVLWANIDSSGINESSQIYNRAAIAGYCCIQDADANDGELYPGQGNIDDDPLFTEMGHWGDVNDTSVVVSPSHPNAVWVDGDYHLLWASPCIDAGDPCGVYEGQVDMDGEGRVAGDRVDMGSDEFWAEPDIEVSPLVHDFGDVELGSSRTVVITISNFGDGALTVSEIAMAEPSSGDFTVAAGPSLPAVIEATSTADVNVVYEPSALGYSSDTLRIVSDDPDEAVVEVELGGVGTSGEVPPSEQIAAILDFVADSVAGGTLVGDGPGKSAPHRLNAFENMLEAAGDLIEGAYLEAACQQLSDACRRTDGQLKPPDFVAGEATPELAAMIEQLMTDLGCE
jgi:hypothetical protein